MTTLGDRLTGLLAGLSVLALCCFAGASARALSPPAPVTAEIVYSNGGRILSMKADGSERKVLASRFKTVQNTDLGYGDPAVSPDGAKLAFTDRRESSLYESYITDIRVADADGSNAVKVLDGDRNDYYSAPSWSPDGERLIAAYYWKRGQKETGGIVSVRPDGSHRKVIFKLKTQRIKRGWNQFSGAAVGSPEISPDGTEILFVRLQAFSFDQDGRLEVLDLGSRKTRLISRHSHGGSWAPDGTRIVHSQRNTGDDEVCGPYGCETAGKLLVVNADGTGSKELVRGAGHEMNPDWSADGSRIVFAGNRNMPESMQAYEVYSVNPEGGCLTWLTNGTPASLAPAWVDLPGSTTDPGGCGDQDRKVLQEVPVSRNLAGRPIETWLGENFDGQLFTGTSGPYPDGPFVTLHYTDCAKFAPRNCGPSLETIQFSICMARAEGLATIIGEKIGKARGVPYLTSDGDGSAQVGVISGKSLFFVLRDSRNRFFTDREILMGMRPFGSETNPPQLPAAVFPAGEIRKMHRVVRVHRRTRSISRTAEILGLSKKTVRQNIKLRPFLRRYGPIRTFRCPGRSNDSGSSNDRMLDGVAGGLAMPG